LKILIEQGATWEAVLTWKINGTPVNLTGYSARMQARESHEATTTVISLASGSGITLGGALGTIALAMSAAATALLTAGKYVYDLELVSAGGEVTRLVEGTLIVTAEVTR
jgi:hypothetical protein